MVTTVDDVKELLEGRGLRPDEEMSPLANPSVFNVVLERLMVDRGVETYDDLYKMFTEAGYELDFDTFYDDCQGDTSEMRDEFVRGLGYVLDLDEEERLAFIWALAWGRVSSSKPPTA